MALRIVPANEAHRSGVRAFNDRLAAGDTAWTFYESPSPDWLARASDASQDGGLPRRTHFVAVDDRDDAIRGGYVLKEERFRLDDREVVIGNVQGPVSEGIVSKRFGMVGALLLRDSLQRTPLQIAWGTSKKKAAVLDRSGWISHRFPLLLRIEHAGDFLKENRIFEDRPAIARAARLLGRLGLGSIALTALRIALSVQAPSLKGVEVVEEASFGNWADEIWGASSQQYRLIANRQAGSLQRIFPVSDWPHVVIIRVVRNKETIGWAAIRDRKLEADATLGTLQAGSIVDALALPGEESTVAAAATSFLKKSGVAIIGAIFTHPTWMKAFRRSGFLAIPNRRYFAISPELAAQGPDFAALTDGAHLTLIDGDGPRLF